uniref:(California timema) hypothetical protein n=1 Tax=Timema californicum TaxID=61474 RepID=A0A7R9PBS6_TIMCA|nr:unnamed protein product [Timema californicum]
MIAAKGPLILSRGLRRPPLTLTTSLYLALSVALTLGAEISKLEVEELEKEVAHIPPSNSGNSEDSAEDPVNRNRRSGPLIGLLSSKISSIASASAHLSGGSSSHPDTEYGPPQPTYDEKSFDFWTFKKALLSTLFTAVKAIKGGIIALKGHLLKAKGNLLASKGRMLAAKGEAITSLGKSIASNALSLNTAPSNEYGPPTGYPAAHSSGSTMRNDFPMGFTRWAKTGYSSPMASLVLTDSSQLTSDSQHLGYSSASGGGVSLTYSGPPPPVQHISSSGFGGSAPSQLYGDPYKRTGTGASAPSKLQLHPTEIRTLISPPSAVDLNTTSASVNYATEAVPEGATAGLLLLKPINVPSSNPRSQARSSSNSDVFAAAASYLTPSYAPSPSYTVSSPSFYSF